MKTSDQQTIVIGGGPGGASTAIYLARFCHPVTLIDAPEEVPGRTMLALDLENILGLVEPMPGPKFLAKVNEQLNRFPIERRNELVTSLSREPDGSFIVHTNRPAQYRGRYVVLAVGVHDIMPDAPGVEDFFGRSIYQCPTCNWYQTKDQNTGIISNDDGGIITALAFDAMERSARLYVIPDRPATHFSEEMLEKAKARHIPVFTSPLVALNGHDGKLESVTLADDTEVDVQVLYTKLGVKRRDIFLDSETIDLDRNTEGYIKVNFETLESSVRNLFAVGPCNTGHDQVMVAAGQGASAAMAIHSRILAEQGI
jgi:thioredoxin reductase (NADPH)